MPTEEAVAQVVGEQLSRMEARMEARVNILDASFEAVGKALTEDLKVVAQDVKDVGSDAKAAVAGIESVSAHLLRMESTTRQLATKVLPDLVCLLPLEKQQQLGFLRSVTSLAIRQYASSLFNHQSVLHLLSEGNERELPHFVPEHPGFLLK
jgi:hypothetical protein